MIIVPSGSSQTFTLNAGDQLTVTSRGGTTVTGPNGLLGRVDGTRSFGAYSVDTVITIAAVMNDCQYGVDEPANAQLSTINGGPAVSGGGSTFPLAETGSAVKPYVLMSWGDSRASFSAVASYIFDVSAAVKSNERSPAWVEALLGDAELRSNFGFSGGTAAQWNELTGSGRSTHGKTYLAMASTYADVCIFQFGVNDAMALTPAADIVANLKANIAEIVKSGKRVLVEATYPVGTGATNMAAAQVIVDELNVLLEAWCATQSPNSVKFVDVATPLKDVDGYFSSAYFATGGIHPNQAGAYLVAKLDVAAIREWLPKKNAQFFAEIPSSRNLLNTYDALDPQTQVFWAAFGSAGTITAPVFSVGNDSDGSYIETTLTATALTSGIAAGTIQISANFNTSQLPYYALVGDEWLEAGARIKVDDGAGGATVCNGIGMRHRFYTGSIYSDAFALTLTPVTQANFTEPLDVTPHAGRLKNLTASASAAPSAGDGYQLQVAVTITATGTPVRVRIYNPQLRRAAYHTSVTTAAGFAIPASTAAYTNTSSGKVQVTVGGGTVTVLAINGVTTGLTSGTFILNPGDTLTPTYSVAPTWKVMHVN